MNNNWIELLQLGLFETIKIQTIKQNYYIMAYYITSSKKNKITIIMLKDYDDNIVDIWHAPSTVYLQAKYWL